VLRPLADTRAAESLIKQAGDGLPDGLRQIAEYNPVS
jgi:hypothetical protein